MTQHTIDDVEAHQYIKNTFNIHICYRNLSGKLNDCIIHMYSNVCTFQT